MTFPCFPRWVMLERFVFRRDDEKSFPDASKAPIRASGTTSLNAPFHIAFSLAEPPLVSRIYARLPGFPGPRELVPLDILATHRHLALLRVATKTSDEAVLQDFFIYDSTQNNPSLPLKALPPCTEPELDFRARPSARSLRPRRPPPQEKNRRIMRVFSMGVLCQGKQDFVVAELKVFTVSRTEVYADIYLLRSCISSTMCLDGEWKSMRVPILKSSDPDDTRQLTLWRTETVIPFNGMLCWIDYYRGILFCDILAQPTPTVSFHRLPLKEFHDTPNRTRTCSWLYRSVSSVDDNTVLKFIDVARDDGIGYGSLKPGAAFTVTCYTFRSGFQDWAEDYRVTSDQLWSANPPESLPHDILMFPQVNIDRPHEVSFLITEFIYALRKTWVVTIDMNTKTVKSFYPYTNGMEDRGTEDADLTKERSRAPRPFLPCEFSKFLHSSRKRKNTE